MNDEWLVGWAYGSNKSYATTWLHSGKFNTPGDTEYDLVEKISELEEDREK